MAKIYGTAYADILKGAAAADFLYGYGGNDRLDGGTGADAMYGGTGNDTYVVDSVYDQVIESAGQGADTVLASISYWLDSNIERLATTNPLGSKALDLIGNNLNNVITGNNGPNAIVGYGGADTLIGGGGNDSLRGGTGSDRLTGGAGSDSFIIDDAASRDTITDFQHGIDNIDLGWFVTDMGPGGFHFIGAAGFSHHAGEGRYANGLFQLDTNGDGVADVSIALTGTLTASDFTFGAGGYWDY